MNNSKATPIVMTTARATALNESLGLTPSGSSIIKPTSESMMIKGTVLKQNTYMLDE